MASIRGIDAENRRKREEKWHQSGVLMSEKSTKEKKVASINGIDA